MRPVPACLALLVLVLAGTVPASATGPGISWQKSLGGSGDDFAYSIQPTDDGGYMVVGDTSSTDGDVTAAYGMRDVWVAKLDANGAKEWVGTIGGSMDDHVSCIERLSDGTLLLSGFTWSHDGDFSDNENPYAIWNMQIDGSGTVLWKRCYPGRSASFAVDGKETPDGGMVMIGQSYTDPLVPGYHGGYDVLVVKSDMNGTIAWEKVLGGSGDDYGDSILPVPGGGYIAVGYTNSNDGDVSGNHGSYDAWLFLLDEGGDLIWQKCIGGSLYEEGREIIVTPGGEYAVMGFSNSNDGDISGNHGSFDYWWATVSPEGEIVNVACFGGSGYDHAYDLEMSPDGSYVALGVSYSDDGDVTGNHGGGDFWAVSFDGTGKILWQKSLGGSGDDTGQSLKPDPIVAGRFSLVGFSTSDDGDVSGNHGSEDYWIVEMEVPLGLKANFTASPRTGMVPLEVRYEDRSTGDPAMYLYDFGDGFRGLSANPVHTYTRPGTYNVSLTVSKVDPVTKRQVRDSITRPGYIVVMAEPSVPLVANFTASPERGSAPLEVRFEDRSTGDPAMYLYDFGDGFRGLSANPVHTYTRPGTYNVSLTVKRMDTKRGVMESNSTTREGMIEVEPSP